MAETTQVSEAKARFRNFILIITLGLVSLFIGLMLWSQHAGLDYAHQIIWSLEIELNENFRIPQYAHFLYNMLIAIFIAITPFSGVDAAVNFSIIMLTMATVSIAYIVWREIYKISPDLSPFIVMFLVFAMLLLTPANILLFNTENPNLYLAFFHPTPYHNPTFIAARPFMLLLVLLSVQIFDDRALSAKTIFAIVTMLVTASMLKPNSALVFAPALLVLAIWYWYRKQVVQWRTLIFGVLLPTALIIGWQFAFNYFLNPAITSASSIALKPMAGFMFYVRLGELNGVGTVFLNFLVTILFPLALLLYPKIRQEKLFVISWLIFLVAVSQAILFTETGERAGHGNFFWGGHLAIFVLYAVSILMCVKMKIYQQRDWRLWLVVAIFILHLLSGFLWFIYSWRTPGVVPLFW